MIFNFFDFCSYGVAHLLWCLPTITSSTSKAPEQGQMNPTNIHWDDIKIYFLISGAFIKWERWATNKMIKDVKH